MAASVSGTSMAPSSRRSSIGSLLYDDKAILIEKVCLPGWKLRRRAPPFLVARGNGGSSDLTIETPSVFDDFSLGVISKDSSTLPRPLTTQSSNSVADGSRLRVAYQGVRGAFSESAAEKAYPNCEAVPCEQFDTVFEAVESWLVDRAVLPFENSLGGSIHRNYDLLLRHSLHIVGEVKLSVRHCLMANHGVEIEDLNRVLSHPQALAQCENTLTRLGLVREAVDDTAGAAKHVALHKLKDAGAVASSTAAVIYGLKILAQDIQDDSDNVTRFHMLAREPIIPGTDRPFKTSIVFSLEEGPGVLFKALAVFALRGINLTKIESRPSRKHPLRSSDENNCNLKYFDYLFYVDFEASMADQNAQNALRHLKEFATFLRVLGSYPVDNGLVEELVNLLCCAKLFDINLTPNSTQFHLLRPLSVFFVIALFISSFSWVLPSMVVSFDRGS